jgi:cobalt/nickel transport system permease protein
MHLHESFENTAVSNGWTQYSVADKTALCGCLLLQAMLLPPWPWAIGVFVAASAFACLWARIPLLLWARALMPVATFGLLGVLPLVWMDMSPDRAIHVTLRSVSAASAVLLLIVTSPAGELLAAGQRILPLRPLVEIIFLSLRFTAIMRECAASAAIAWHCRGGERRPARFRYSLYAVASLFVRSLDRARRMDTGLTLRSGIDTFQFWAPTRRVSWKLRLATAISGGSMAGAAFLLRRPIPWR